MEHAGYVLIDVGRTQLAADVRAIANRRRVDSPVTSIASFAMDQGSSRLIRA